ncbi:MAG TPA: hypothetical protein VFN74_15340 [Chloroflexota bacterium]|jgi:hypothetical protein|nr:hypothetical protein [Chloroflexota bacterium]
MTTLLERFAHPIREIREWTDHLARERAARAAEHAAEREAHHAEVIQHALDEYAAAEQVFLRPYRELSPGEVRFGNTPAFEYFHHTGELRLFNVLPRDLLERAALTEAFAFVLDEDGVPDGDTIDVKPHDIPPFEYGAINLTSPQLREVHNVTYRIFLTITYSAVQGSFRGGIQTRRFITDVTL